MIMKFLLPATLAFLLIHLVVAKKDDSCEVCEKFMGKFVDSIADLKDKSKLEDRFRTMCKDIGGKENKFCYLVGGLDISATSILSEIMEPVKSGVPVIKICQRIKKKIPDICDIKYDKPIDLSNLKKLKVKDLKKVLADWGQLDKACKGCMEKSEFIKAVEELMPKYAPEFVKAKKEL